MSNKQHSKFMQIINHWLRVVILLSIILLILSILGIKQYKQEKQANDNFYKTEKQYNTYGRFSNKFPGIVVLCYHRILPSNPLTHFAQKKSHNSQLHSFNVNENDFKYQMKYLKDHNINVISIDQMMDLLNSKKPITKKYIVITFDDIDHTIVNNAIPTLEKYKFPFTLFIATGKTHNYIEGSYLASWSDINKINENPLCTVGLHTNNGHFQENGKPRLLTMTNKEFQEDCTASINALHKHLNRQPKNLYFAPPYGAITQSETNYINTQTPIKGIFSLDNNLNDKYRDNHIYDRLVVTNDVFANVKKWLSNPKHNDK